MRKGHCNHALVSVQFLQCMSCIFLFSFFFIFIFYFIHTGSAISSCSHACIVGSEKAQHTWYNQHNYHLAKQLSQLIAVKIYAYIVRLQVRASSWDQGVADQKEGKQ